MYARYGTQVEPQETGLYMFKALNGWQTTCTTAERRDPATGAPVKGLVLSIAVQRSIAVRFFSMFIVILMCVRVCMHAHPHA